MNGLSLSLLLELSGSCTSVRAKNTQSLLKCIGRFIAGVVALDSRNVNQWISQDLNARNFF